MRRISEIVREIMNVSKRSSFSIWDKQDYDLRFYRVHLRKLGCLDRKFDYGHDWWSNYRSKCVFSRQKRSIPPHFPWKSSVNLQVFVYKWPIFDGSFFLGNFLFIRTSYIQKYKYQLKENPFLSKYFYFCSDPEI